MLNIHLIRKAGYGDCLKLLAENAVYGRSLDIHRYNHNSNPQIKQNLKPATMHADINVNNSSGSNMKFTSPLTEAILLRRHKRFLVDIAVNKTDRETIYCPNTSAMRGLDILGSRIWYSTCSNQRRKYPHTWEMVEVDGGHKVAVNSQRKNPLVLEAIDNGILKELLDYETIDQEVQPEGTSCKFDFKLSKHKHHLPDAFVEVKVVTMGDEIHRGFYPESENLRATQQLKALQQLKQEGYRAVLVFCVMHTGINRVFPADHIDNQFGYVLREAYQAGVEIIAYQVQMDEQGIIIEKPCEVCVPQRTYGTRQHSKN